MGNGQKGFTTIFVLLAVFVLAAGILFSMRFLVGGDEDIWLCQSGEWVKHGNPSRPVPNEPCPSGLTPSPRVTEQVTIYYANLDKQSDKNDCGEVFPLKRQLTESKNYEALLDVLFAGPTEEEEKAGYSSFFSKSTADILKSVKVVGTTAYVDLQDIRTVIPNASTSCGSLNFFASVGETLKHDRKITKVIYAIEGDPEPFYEWMQLGCQPENNNCDKAPFR